MEFGTRSVLHLDNGDRYLRAVFKRDLHVVAFNMSEQCRTNGGDRAHDFDTFARALLFDMSNEVCLGVISIVAFEQNGHERKNADFA